MKNTSVEHGGVIESISNQTVRVGFVSHAACSSCHARGACSLSEVENKFVEVETTDGDWSVGQEVKILLEQKMGFKALWYGYVLPLIVMVLGLIIVQTTTGKDGLAGIVALGLLAPYYAILYIFRKELKNKFEFRLKK